MGSRAPGNLIPGLVPRLPSSTRLTRPAPLQWNGCIEQVGVQPNGPQGLVKRGCLASGPRARRGGGQSAKDPVNSEGSAGPPRTLNHSRCLAAGQRRGRSDGLGPSVLWSNLDRLRLTPKWPQKARTHPSRSGRPSQPDGKGGNALTGEGFITRRNWPTWGGGHLT